IGIVESLLILIGRICIRKDGSNTYILVVELSGNLFAASLAIAACTAGSRNDIAVLTLAEHSTAAVLADLNIAAVHLSNGEPGINGLAAFVLFIVVEAILAFFEGSDHIFMAGRLVKFAAAGAEAGVSRAVLVLSC